MAGGNRTEGKGNMANIVQHIPHKTLPFFLARRRLSPFSANVVVVFAVKTVSTIIGMATGIVVARALGPSGKGSFTLVTTFPALVFCLVHLGIAEANVYFLRRQTGRIEAAIVRANTLFLTGLISGITILVLLIFKPYICASVLSGLSSGYFYIILLLIPFFIFETFGSSLLIAFERFKLLSSLDFLLRLFDTVSVLVVLYALHLGLAGVVLCFLLYFVIKCVALFWLGFWRQPIRRYPDLRAILSSVTFGLKSHAQSLTGVLHYKIDIYILAAFLGAIEIGYYSIAVALVSLIFFIPNAVGHVMYPRIAALKEGDAHIFTAQACRNTLFITMLPAVTIMVCGRFLIELMYGAQYLPACEALYLLMPGTISMCIYKILTRNFTSRNRQQLTVYAGLLGLGTNIVLNLALIPGWGIAGAALATTISYSTTSFLLLFFFLRESRMKLMDSLIIKRSDIAEIIEVAQRVLLPQKARDDV
jgi:O-antigen/teichoic acid export membrane protein